MALRTDIVINVASQAATRAMAAFGGLIKGVGAAVFSLKSALVLLGGAAGFGLLIKRSMNATDTLAKTASKIGTTTEALSKLQYAASITGVEQNTLNMAMQRFTRRAAEAAKGTGEAKGALQELNIDAKELQKLPLDKQMQRLAVAFKTVKSEQDKLRIAFKLFDSEGAALVNTLRLGEDGLEKLFGRAKALGLVMSSDAANGVENANDALNDLFSISRGLIDQFTAALAPAVQQLATNFTNFLTSINESDGGIQKFSQGLAIKFLNGVRVAIQGLHTLLSVIDQVTAASAGFFSDAAAPEKVVKRIKRDLADLQNEYFDLADIRDKIAKGDAGLHYFVYGKGEQGVSAVTADMQAVQDKMTVLQAELDKAKNNTDSFGTSLAGMIDIEKINKTFDDLVASIGKMGDASTQNLEPITDTLGNVEQGFRNWQQSLPTLEQSLQSVTQQGINGLTQAMTDGITGAKSFSEAFRSMASQVVNSLVRMFVQYKIVEPMFQYLFGSSGGSNSNFNPQSTSPVSGGYSRPLSPRAIGGSVQAGQPYMVGERGMEMFVPNQSGAIVANNKLGGGGVTINQSINISTGVSQTVRAEIATLMPQITEATKSAVAEARMRGGAYSKALMGG